MPSEAAGDRDAVVGDECHIVGQTPDSARYRDDLSIDPDSYDNLIVLCKTHHKQIDDQPERFAEEKLIALKEAHEQWVRTVLEIGSTTSGSPKSSEGITLLPRITSGKRLVSMCRGCHAFQYDHEELETEEDTSLIAGFLQEVEDLDILEDLGTAAIVQAGFTMGTLLQELEQQGYMVFGERKRQKMRVGDAIVDWQIATIVVLRESNPTIIKIPAGVDTDG